MRRLFAGRGRVVERGELLGEAGRGPVLFLGALPFCLPLAEGCTRFPLGFRT